MADLPVPAVTFLNVIGIPWPYVNENQVSQFATLAPKFGTEVQTTHQDTTRAVSSGLELVAVRGRGPGKGTGPELNAGEKRRLRDQPLRP